MQLCTSLQTDNYASTPPLSILQARCPSCRPTNSVKALKELTWLQKIPGLFQDPRSIFLGPGHKPAMFKYRDKQQFDSMIAASIHTGVWILFITVTCCEEIAKKLFEHFLHTMFHIYKLLHEEVEKFFSASSFHRWFRRAHHCLVNSRNLQDLALKFPGPGNFTSTILGVSRKRGSPVQT